MGFFCVRIHNKHVSLTRTVFELYRVAFVLYSYAGVCPLCGAAPVFYCKKQRNNAIKKEVYIMTQNNNSWKRNYFTLLIGQGVSFISSGILQMAIIFYLVAKTNSAIILTAATLIGFLPQACLGPFAGAFVDRHSRKSVMIGADLIIAAAGGILALVAFYMELPVWSIMVVLLIRSAGTAFHSPAFSAATPMIVPKEELTKCAGYTQTMQAVSAIISPAAAAFLYAVWPLNAIILLDIVGAILACVTVAISSIPTPELCPETKRQQFLQDMKEGYVVLKQNRGLFALLWIGVIYMFFYMPISTLFPLICMSYFKGTPAHASAAEIAFAVGMLLGGVILSIWGGFKKRRYTIGLSVLLMGVSNMLSGLLPPDAFLVFVVCCTVMGISAPFYGVQNAIFQETVKPEYLGRVFSLLTSAASLAMPFGLVISGPLAERLGVEKWFVICGIGIIIVALAVFLLPGLREIDNTQ